MNEINEDSQIKVMNKVKEEAERYLNIYRPTHGHLVLDDQYMKQIRASLEYGLLTRILNDIESVDVNYLNQLVERLGESITANTTFKLSELSNAISSINNQVSSLNIQAIRDSIASELYTRFNRDDDVLGLRLKALEDTVGTLTVTPNSVARDFKIQLESATDGITSRVSALEQYKVSKTADDILSASKVSQLEALYEDNNKKLLARIREENEARIDGYKALSQQITSMVSQVNDSVSTIEDVKRTYSDLEQSYSERISTLESSFRANDVDIKAKLREQSRTLTNANKALAEKVTELEANVDDKIGAKFNETIETVATQQEALARKVTELNSSFLGLDGKLEGTIREEIKTVSDANKVHLSKIEELEGKTDNTLGKIESLKESIVTPEQVTNIVSDEMVAKYSNVKDRILDTRNTNELPRYYYNKYPNALAKEIKLSAVMGIDGEGELGYLETQTIGTNYREGRVTQVFYCEDGDTYKRVSITEDLWGVWKLQETDESAREKLRLALLEIQQKIVESEARIENYNKTHSDATKALAESIKQLEADYKEGDRIVNSRILTMEQVQSTVDTASASTLRQLNSALDQVKGSIRNLQTTVTNPDGTVNVSEDKIRSLILDENKIKETKDVNRTPEWYVNNHLGSTVKELKTSKVIGLTQNGDGYLETSVLSSNVSRGSVKQEAITEDGKIYTRQSTGLRRWSDWVESESTLTAKARLIRAKEELERELSRVYSEFTDYKETRARENEAEALRIQGISTKLDSQYGTLRGLIETEERSRLTQDAAINSRIDNISSELGNNFATIRSVNDTKVTLENSIARKGEEITAGFDNKLIEERSITNRDIRTSVEGVTSELLAKIEEYKEVTSSARTAFNDYKEVNDNAVRALGERQNSLKGEYTQAIVEASQELRNKIDDISIGGRNLLKNTGDVEGYSVYHPTRGTFSTHDGYVRVDSTGLGNQGIQVKGHHGHLMMEGDYGILSFEYRTNANNLDYTYILANNGNWAIEPTMDNVVRGVWSKAVLPFTAPRTLTDVRALVGSTRAYNGVYIELRKVKLEIGNKVTDWSPAPEDFAESIRQVRTIATTAKSNIDRFERTLNTATQSLAETNKNMSAKFTETETLITQAKGDAVELARQGAIDLIEGTKSELKRYSDANIRESEKTQATRNAAFARRDEELQASISSLPTTADVEAKVRTEREARVNDREALVKQITKGSVRYPNGTGDVNQVSTVLNDIIRATADSSFVNKSSQFKATVHREVDEKLHRNAGNLLTDTVNYTSWTTLKSSHETIIPRLSDGIWELNGSSTSYKEVILYSKEGTKLEENKASESLVQVTEDSDYILEFEAKGNVPLNVFIRIYFYTGGTRRFRHIINEVPLTSTWTKYRVKVKCPALETNEERDCIGVFFQSLSVGNAQIRKPRLYLDPSVLTAAIKEYRQMKLDMQGNIDAKIGLTVDGNNRITGWTATENKNSSEFTIFADKFKIANSSRTSTPFSIDGRGNITFNGKVSFNSVTDKPAIPTQNNIETWARNQINLQNPVLKGIRDSIPNNDAISRLAKIEADKKDAAISQVTQQMSELGDRLQGLNDNINQAFKDNIIEEAEAKAIEKYVNILNKEKDELNNAFSTIYRLGIHRGSREEREYIEAKSGYITAHTQLIRAINNAIRDGRTTAEQKRNVDTKFENYNTKLNAAKSLLNQLSTTFADRANQTASSAVASVNTAKQEAIRQAGVNADSKISLAKQEAINTAFEDATDKANAAKRGAIDTINTKIANLEIGGRNLIIGSDVFYTLYQQDSRILQVSPDVAGAKSLTLSFYIEITGNRNTIPENDNHIGASVRIVYSDGSEEWFDFFRADRNFKGRVSKTFTVPKGKTLESVNGCYIQTRLRATRMKIEKPKLERGDFATDWTPALEDSSDLKVPHILSAQGAHNHHNAWMKINTPTGLMTLNSSDTTPGIVVQIINQNTLDRESYRVFPRTSRGYLDMKNFLNGTTANRIVMIMSRTNLPVVDDINLKNAFRRAGSTDLIYNTVSKRTNTTFALIGTVGVEGSASEAIVDTAFDMFGKFASVSVIWHEGSLLPGNRTLVDGGTIVTNSITANQIAANAITADKIDAGSITANKIHTNAIEARHINTGAVTTDAIYANAITTDKINARAIRAKHIDTEAIKAKHIEAETITAKQIADATLTMAKIKDAIESDNYKEGKQGWKLYKNGNFELNNTFGDGSSIEINSKGLIVWYDKDRRKKAVELGIFT